ncbi:uncharacterized protein LY89DRAFT_7284 [Mollisia scopiformis]|uniref:C2H2-type domain-containing protein n=1 Tax=Mollisia scopiformis TaxID=149040 RepID=A0A194XUD2_MOLSC|nr:uncharacterized protein LY89DRAFT_7284 [Mollisia scopiformis]KUJ23925.1 hypothetical protein LY89DRAFT_7284 [Mollisia scopiformis]
MAGTENMRWPQPRSPEQLRAFYSIALQSDDNDSKVSAEYHESRSVASSTWSSSGSVRAHASRSTSIFSGQARTGSSATSVSDSRTIVALAPKTTYEDTTGLLRLHEWQCSHAPNFESDANETSFVAEGIDTDVSYQSEKNEDEPVGYKWRGGRSLPRLHRCQVQDETSKHDAGSDPVIPVSTQPEPAEKFWLDTLQEHPYCNLDTKRKLGRVGMWAVKRRRRDLKLGISSTKGKADVESDTKLAKDKLLEDSNSSLDSDDETVHIVDDVVEEVASLMGSSNSRLRRSYSRLSKPGSADRTLLLNLGVDPSLRSSFDSAYVDNPSILSSSTSIGTLELSTCADLRDMEEDGLATHAPRVTGNHQHVNSTLYCCLFCLKVFGSQEVWEEHERSQHVAMQKDWICMPWGPIERNEDGHEVCVFCGLVDPDSSHCSEHNDEPCCHTSVSRRTFDCKADFQEHLEDVHDQFIISDCMRKWSFAAEDIDWYWQCGFCDRSLVGWEDRSRHIGRHFKEGLSMGSWDPVVPSCPVDRGTGIVVSWSPPIQMDRRTLLTVQSESISR